MLTLFVTTFIISLALTIALTKFSGDLGKSEQHINQVQAAHRGMVSRIGGLSVFASFSIAMFALVDYANVLIYVWLSSLPIFIVGTLEDISGSISPRIRLIFTFLSVAALFISVDIGVSSLGFEWVDYLFANFPVISLLFTLLVLGGAINSLNIIDGLNGLLGAHSIFSSLAIAYIAYILGDQLILQLSLALVASVLGFFVINFPFGKIFMGDGGAYFLGFVLSAVGLMLADRHTELSNWFVLLIFMYPMYDLLYSIYRRKIVHSVDATHPDNAHLHSLVYQELVSNKWCKGSMVICNSIASSLMWLISLMGIIPAVIWFNDQFLLIIFAFLFMCIYTILYRRIFSYSL